MKLTNEWFTALAEEDEFIVSVYGRKHLEDFVKSGKYRYRIEVKWTYSKHFNGMPVEKEAEEMEQVESILIKTMESDKLAIVSGIYTGAKQKTWVFYSRNSVVFGNRLNEALSSMRILPLELYVEEDPEWEEYTDMLEMEAWSVDED